MLETDENMTKQSSFISRVAVVQQPRALRLGCDHGLHAFGGERGKRRIVDHHREVKDAAQRLPARCNLREQSLDVVRRTNVRLHDANLDTAFLQTGHELSGLRTLKRRCGS